MNTVDEAILTTENALKVVDEGCKIIRKRAIEVMVWVLTDKDRNSKLEMPCSLPTAYWIINYRLTSQAFRNATEEVLKESRQRGIRVLRLQPMVNGFRIWCETDTRNQWQLMSRVVWDIIEKKPRTCTKNVYNELNYW